MTWVKQYKQVLWIVVTPHTTRCHSVSLKFSHFPLRSLQLWLQSHLSVTKPTYNDLNPYYGDAVLYCSAIYVLWQQTSQAPSGPQWPLRQPWSSCASPLGCPPGGDIKEKVSEWQTEECHNIIRWCEGETNMETSKRAITVFMNTDEWQGLSVWMKINCTFLFFTENNPPVCKTSLMWWRLQTDYLSSLCHCNNIGQKVIPYLSHLYLYLHQKNM